MKMTDLNKELKELNDILKKKIESYSGCYPSENVGFHVTVKQLSLLQDSVAEWIYQIKKENEDG